MPSDEQRLRIEFLTESRAHLADRRASLADEFSRELRRRRGECIEAQVLRGEDAQNLEADEAMESETARALIRAIASHPQLGMRLRELAGEIDEVDRRLAQVEADIQALTGARPKGEQASP